MEVASAGFSTMINSFSTTFSSILSSAYDSVDILEGTLLSPAFLPPGATSSPLGPETLSKLLTFPLLGVPPSLPRAKPSARSKMFLGHLPPQPMLSTNEQAAMLEDAANLKGKAFEMMTAAAVSAGTAADQMNTADSLTLTVDSGLVPLSEAPQLLDTADTLMHSAKQLVLESEAMQEGAEQLLSFAAAKEDFALNAQIAFDTTASDAASSTQQDASTSGAAAASFPVDSTVVVLIQGPDSSATAATTTTTASSSSSSVSAIAAAASALDDLLTKFAEEEYEEYYMDYLEDPSRSSSRSRIEGVEGVWDAAWDVAISLQHRLWSLASSAAAQALSPIVPASVSETILSEVPYAVVIGPVESIMAAKREAQLRALAQAVQQVLFVLNKEQLDGLLGVDMRQGLSSRAGGAEPQLQVLAPLQQYMQVPTGEALHVLLQEQLTAMFFDAMLMVREGERGREGDGDWEGEGRGVCKEWKKGDGIG